MKLSGVTERIERLFRKETELSRKQIVKKENRIKDGQRLSVFKICLIVFLILYRSRIPKKRFSQSETYFNVR